ncbi:MAG: DUF3683 domain-containing protein [Magnetococcales bacterium]|nr:DUF3683 domain-containing protein [Magnetococcales bacterium]NGZ26393.1 DUF3683 domain-containing protein [Magnetococcales bacterium]
MSHSTSERIREIPYNYTSFSDREIVQRFLGAAMWPVLEELRGQRRTGRSARLLFEVLGELWAIDRNPYLLDDLLENAHRRETLLTTLWRRIDQIEARAEGNTLAFSLLAAASKAVENLAQRFREEKDKRQQVMDRLSRITRRDNIDFGGAAKVAHVTDASDWRVDYPFVVIRPDSETQVAPIVRACIELGLIIIPRGGGTGYTGSALPLHPFTAVINTEKLDLLGNVETKRIPGQERPVAVIRAGAGVVTKRVAEAAEAAHVIFAVDPTSQNSSTIGGNISMNAGGKKAVRWGTTLDNLFSWRMVDPQGNWLEVTRLDHNLGKIHDLPNSHFRIIRYQNDGKTPMGDPEFIILKSHEIRKPGLGKDVTNKVLGGLPGVQKEGCDGIITSAVFVLHPQPAHTQTICLEFYSKELAQAVPAIVEIKNYLDRHPQVGCAGLEHLDERYIRAVGYSSKAARGDRPRMVLLIDIIGDQEEALQEAAQRVVAMARTRQGEGFVATTAEARQRFWADRSRTAAIAAHTNAFKINEDVVIPLERLADYSEGIERLNIENSIQNKLAMVAAIREFLANGSWRELVPADLLGEDQSYLDKNRQAATEILDAAAKRWQTILDHLDEPVAHHDHVLEAMPDIPLEEPLLRLLLRRDLTISYRQEVEKPLKRILDGEVWQGVRQQLDTIHQQVLSSRLFAALHMHAGDGNVHTNIPVNSNDYAMLQQAWAMVERIMNLAVELGGAISGEHGIGMTKLNFMDAEKLNDFARYKKQVDPHGHFNRGKLLAGADLDKAYTPSLRLVQQEALILKETDLEALNDDMRNCLRCGKCKAVCNTHAPRANLLYSPRNKILAAGLIIEAFLYEEQARRKEVARHFQSLQELADHCTLCHKCVTPCPVKIDFGQVTIRMRQILKHQKRERLDIGKKAALAFLSTNDPRTIGVERWLMRQGFRMQRLACKATRLRMPGGNREKRPHATVNNPSLQSNVLHMLKTPLPILPEQTFRAMLEIEGDESIPILRQPGKENGEVVFYFPGCGCERMYSQVSLASVALLLHMGVTVVLPPGYLCCGFPQAASGDVDSGRHISTGNRVLFHRVANALNYLEIHSVIISCGTCMDQLTTYQLPVIFPGCRMVDIHEFLWEKGLQAPAAEGGFLFHDPCHSPMKGRPPMQIVEALTGQKGVLTDRCCGEAGTFAISRPDIASQVRHRKQDSIRTASRQVGVNQPTPLYTSCPACLQGLTRYEKEMSVQAQFLVVELAQRLLGDGWQKKVVEQLRAGGIEKVLL